MSTALAIAGVTQVLRDLLNDRFINQNVAGQIGQSVTVSTLPPDKVVQQNGVEVTQLNLFLRHVTPNMGWRNEGLPSRDVAGKTRLSNPPLALNLHYIVSAYGAAELHSEILLGHAMQLLHENPAIPRAAIRNSLVPDPEAAASLPAWLRSLRDSGLADQVEQLRVTPEYLSTEEMSKFWTSTLTQYRPSAAYQVSVVLIVAEQPKPSPLPVLVRSISAAPALVPTAPTLMTFSREDKQPVIELDEPARLDGFSLQGAPVELRFTNDRFKIDLDVLAAGTPTRIDFTIPASRTAEFPVGVYRVSASVQKAGEPRPRVTNELAVTIAPAIGGFPIEVTRTSGTATFSLTCVPKVRVGQRVTLLLGSQEYAPKAFEVDTEVIDFDIPNAPVGSHLARLRVDGIDSPIVNVTVSTPKFLDRRITIT